MARRRLTITLDPIVRAAAEGAPDDAASAMLDAAEGLLREQGLHRWSVEDVADRAGIGRTSVYRRFPSRDDLVHGVLARELRRATESVGAAALGGATIEAGVAAAVVAALAALDGSVVDHLLHAEPADVLPLLTTGAGPLIAQAGAAFVPGLLALGIFDEPAHAEVAAEAIARLGLSLVLTRETALPLDDPAALRAVVASFVGTVLGSSSPNR